MRTCRLSKMPDVHDAATRSRNMAAIRARNTSPELIVRKGLHHAGFRYRLHTKSLPGRPDLVFAKHRAAIFVNGCFWHGHSCPSFKWPVTRQDFWRQKLQANMERDQKNYDAIEKLGWRRATVWECAIRGPSRVQSDYLVGALSDWLLHGHQKFEIPNS